MKSCSINSRNELSPKCEVVHETKLTSDISFPTDSFLAQLAERETDDLEVMAGFWQDLAENSDLQKNSIEPDGVWCRWW